MANARSDDRRPRASGECRTVLRGASTHDGIEALTDRVCQALCTCPMPERTRFHLRLIVHEALANAAEHGNSGDPAKLVTVTCHCDTRTVTVTIDDEGDGFDPAAVPDPTAQENLLEEGGRGIFLIHAFADECRFEKGGRRIVIVKHLDAPASQPGPRG